MTNILITGSTGFVGKNLIPYLTKKGIKTYSLDRSQNQDILLEQAFVWDKIDEVPFNEFSAIIHLAGKAHDLSKTSNEQAYFDINLGLTQHLTSKAIEKGFSGKFIQFSSVKAVADTVTNTLKEDFIGTPLTPYGKSKLKAEEHLQIVYKNNPEKLFILRPCMIHGPFNKGNLNLLFQFVQKGIPYPLGAFKNNRSLLAVDNLCFILEQIIIHPIAGGIYNMADSKALSTTEMTKIIGQTIHKKVNVLNIPIYIVQLLSKIGDIIPLPLNSERLKKLTENYIVDNSKILKVLKTDLPLTVEEGLQKTIKSFI